MLSRENLRFTGSTGSISRPVEFAWDHWRSLHSAHLTPELEPFTRYTFYTAYTMCYNTLMQALKQLDPGTAADLIARIREELNESLDQSGVWFDRD